MDDDYLSIFSWFEWFAILGPGDFSRHWQLTFNRDILTFGDGRLFQGNCEGYCWLWKSQVIINYSNLLVIAFSNTYSINYDTFHIVE